MNTNLLDVLRKSFTKESYHDISEYVGINSDSTKNGINAIIPAFLASILGNNTTENAVQPTWWNALKDDYPEAENEFIDTKHIDTSSFLIKGREVIAGMFRTNHDDLVGSVSSVAGVQKEKATGLIEIAVPLMMGFLTNWMRKKAWKFKDLIANLLEHKTTITKALPMGISATNFGVNEMSNNNLSEAPREDVLDSTKTDFSKTMEAPIPSPSPSVETVSEPLHSDPSSSIPEETTRPKTLILKNSVSKPLEPVTEVPIPPIPKTERPKTSGPATPGPKNVEPKTVVPKAAEPIKESTPKKSRNGVIWLVGVIILAAVLWYFLR